MARPKRFDVVTMGGAVRDVNFLSPIGQLISTPHNLTSQKMLAFEYGAKIGIEDAYFTMGGGAANSAVSFRRLGYKTATICRTGKDEAGSDIASNLKRQKVDTSLIQIDPKVRSGLSFILSHDRKEREHIIFAYRGANNQLLLQPKKLASLRTKWVYLTSLGGSHWSKNLKTIIQAKKKMQALVAWNPGGVQLSAGKRALAFALSQTDVLILNKDEAIELALSGIKVGRRNPSYLNKPLYLLNILYDWGPKIVVVTLGPRGAWAFDGTKIYQQRCVKSKNADTCGIGDCFGSTFIGGLLANKGDIQKSLKWGVVNSASVISKFGAQNGLLNRRELLSKV